MTLYTDKQFYIEEYLRKKLDLMVERMTGKIKKDNVLIMEGGEGEGKTNFSVQIGYYIAQQTGRSFDESNLYFSLQDMIDKAKSTKEQIFIWDEPALTSLRSDWAKAVNKDLIRLVMMARKKKHFIIFNFTKFFKFDEYLVVDRAVGMIHVYSKDEMKPGRFVYYKKRAKERLYDCWRSTKKREYRKHKSFRGTFPFVLPQLIDEKKYEARKDKAIMQIGVNPDDEKDSKKSIELNNLKHLIAQQLGVTDVSKAESFKVSTRTIGRWRKIKFSEPGGEDEN